MATVLDRPYTTIERVKHECRLRQSETDNDDWIRTCINDASRAVERHMGILFKFHDHTSTAYTVPKHDVVEDKIFLPYPILTLTDVSIGGYSLDSDDYEYENKSPMGYGSEITLTGSVDSFIGASLFAESDDVTLTGTFGYTQEDETVPADDLPTEVVRACTLIASAFSGYNQREVLNYTGDRVSLTDSRIPEEAMLLMKHGKRLVM